MIILITGASHTGKTLLAQRILEARHYPYLSIDHLKMGLIRSGYTNLTPADDGALTAYLWPILREMIKTAIENGQDLVIEGCYIPFDWQTDFEDEYLSQIRFYCLVMTPDYIARHFTDIRAHASDIEQRLDDEGCTRSFILEGNARYAALCRQYGVDPILIDEEYQVNIDDVGR